MKMKSKNFKKEKMDRFGRISESDINLKKAEETQDRLDLRKIDSSVIRLVEAKKKIRKELFEKGLF
jgi:hypothetical protein